MRINVLQECLQGSLRPPDCAALLPDCQTSHHTWWRRVLELLLRLSDEKQVRVHKVGDRGAAAAATPGVWGACVRLPLRHDPGTQQVSPSSPSLTSWCC